MRRVAVVLFLVFALLGATAFCQQKVVALTFDDGPNLKFSGKVMHYLERQQIRATFFVIGYKAKQFPDLVLEEFEAGHEVENHTFGHVCLVKPNSQWTGCQDLSVAEAIRQLKTTNDIIQSITGYSCRYLRPPYFAMTKEREMAIQQLLGMEVVKHGADSIGSLDWVYNSPQKIVAHVKNEAVRRGMKSYIIVFHETSATLEALPPIVDFFKNNGYLFVRLDRFEQYKKGEVK